MQVTRDTDSPRNASFEFMTLVPPPLLYLEVDLVVAIIDLHGLHGLQVQGVWSVGLHGR